MDQIKQRIAEVAATFVQDGIVVGLGTGSTAASFIQALAHRYEEEGLNIVTVASSYASENLARDLGLPFVSIDAVTHIDMTFDGADEVDQQMRIIKGKGGALLKEKILARASHELVVMCDETKCVDTIGKVSLPVEVVQFGHALTGAELLKYASSCKLRRRGDGRVFITESQHFIYDIQLNLPIENYAELEHKLLLIPGVVETGLFLNQARRVIVGMSDGSVKTLSNPRGGSAC